MRSPKVLLPDTKTTVQKLGDFTTDGRVLYLMGLGVVVGVLGDLSSWVLFKLIYFCTNVAYYGQLSFVHRNIEGSPFGWYMLFVPVAGSLIVGLMARYGSDKIRGHGIPEAIEAILIGKSRIQPKVAVLKPLSSAISIGTGGPFGAEGPIIMTGGALGSLLAQTLNMSSSERKTLLVAGAAAGMTAVFGTPVASILLAVELLLFEWKPRSFLPVAVSAIVADALRPFLMGGTPIFPYVGGVSISVWHVAAWALMGVIAGFSSGLLTALVYACEDLFEKLPLHWMWWPALGGLVVGVVGYFAPLTLGVGYSNIEDIVSGRLTAGALVFLCVMKFISWSISLGSGTSGGTLAPLFTIGGSLGGLMGIGIATIAPHLGVNADIAALVGMAAIFAGASRALLTTVVFALETTGQPAGLLPLLGACTAAYLVSALMMRDTIMTEKIARRGVKVPSEYLADYLDRVSVADVCERSVVTLKSSQTLEEVRQWMAEGKPESQHQGYPIVGEGGKLLGVLTRRTFFTADWPVSTRLGDLISRPPVAVSERNTLREAADHMAEQNVGRLIVLDGQSGKRVVGMLTRSDLISAHSRRLKEGRRRRRYLSLKTYQHIRRHRTRRG